MVNRIRKRDGSVVPFNKDKISEAIWKAVKAVGGTDRERCDYLSLLVIRVLDEKYKSEADMPDVEEVQNTVEKVLIEEGHAKVAKAYILYRKSHEELRNVKGLFDTIEVVDDYVGLNDWMVKENSNMGFSLQGLNNYIATKIITNYWIRRIYPEAIRLAHEAADIHIHDLGTLGAYCFDDKTKILTESGWKFFKDVNNGEKVATKNLKTGELEFQIPHAKQIYNYDGEMYSFEGKGVSLLVTPEHRLLARRKGKKEWEFINPPEFKYGMEFDKKVGWTGEETNKFKIPSIKGGNRKRSIGNYNIKDYLEFMGWYISEGSAYEPSKGDYRISIAQSEKKYREEICELLSKMKINYNNQSEFNLHMHSKELFYHVKELGTSKNKYIPKEIKKLSSELIKIFITTLFKGDGSFYKGKLRRYYTNSERLAGDVVECLLKIGLCGTIRKRKDNGMYIVDVETNHLTPIYRKKLQKKQYRGHVYDFSVPNTTLVVMREGKVVVSGNCVGWDLKDLLVTGFRGVVGKVSCKPPKHLRTACAQLVNFFYTLQGETAGAQAFSNFDSLLAPFIRYDKLDYKEVRQIMQEFLFGLAVPTRVGFQCMSDDTEILTPNGWKGHSELKEGDVIKTFNIHKNCIEEKPIKKLFARKYSGIMYNLKNRIQDQLISPGHRVVRKKFGGGGYLLESIEDVARMKSPFIVPVCAKNNEKDISLSDEQIKLMAWIISEGTIEKQGKHRCCYRVSIYQSEIKNNKNYLEIKKLLNHFGLKFSEYEQKGLGQPVKRMRLDAGSSKKIHEWFSKESISFVPEILMNMSEKQSRIFLETYLKADGFEDTKIAVSNPLVLDCLEQIAVNAGYGFTVLSRKPTIGKKIIYVLRLIKHQETYIQNVKKINYEGIIWCPNTDNETVIARRNGKVFITGNTPFTNVTMDLECPSYMRDEQVIIGGAPQKETYKEFQVEMDMLNRAFAEGMLEGDADGRVFTFPIPTYNITKDFDWDNPKLNPIWEMTAKYGIPYFSNFINSDMKPEDARSMCCRLRIDNTELRKRGGGLFGANPLTGSIGVVTLNMPRIGFTSLNEEEFLDKVSRLMDLSKDSLEIKRKSIERFTEGGLYPYSKFYLRQVFQRYGQYWKNHFSTIGLLGMNEAIMNFMPGEDITTPKGRDFAIRVLKFMRTKLEEYQKETGNIYNLEATPGEGTSYRFARADKKRFGRIIVANERAVRDNEAKPYYTNSTQLPVKFTDDIFEALDLQDELQIQYTGGCIEKGNKVLTNKGLMKIEEIVKNFKNLKPIRALSYNTKEEASEWDEITDAMSIDVGNNNKIKVNGERGLGIVTSDWHPFFVKQKIAFNSECPICKKKIKNIKSLAVHLKLNKDCRDKYEKIKKYEIIEKRADNLKKGDYILQNSSNVLTEKKSNINKELMWLIGFFIGDGCISNFIDNRGNNNLNKYKLRFFSGSKKVLEIARNIILKYFNAEVKVIQNDKRSKVLLELGTSKKEVLDFFFNLGFKPGKKVYDVSIPLYVKKKITKHNFFSLLSGLMDSDGHITKRDGDFEYCTVSESLAEDIFEMCNLGGISISKFLKRTKRKNEKNIYRLRIPSYQMTLIKDKINANINVDRINQFISNRTKRHFSIVRVKSTSKVNIKDNKFYDLTTKKNHNYLAGKNCLVFVHNTVLHGFIGEKITKEAVKKIVKKIAEKYRLPYFTITPTFSICPKHGYISGEHEYCPKCDEEIGYNPEMENKIEVKQNERTNERAN